jgi:hypothetical protein
VSSLLKTSLGVSAALPAGDGNHGASAPKDAAANHLISAAATGNSQAVVAAAKAVAAVAGAGREDDKTHVATVLASLGNGWLDSSAVGSAPSGSDIEAATKKARNDQGSAVGV